MFSSSCPPNVHKATIDIRKLDWSHSHQWNNKEILSRTGQYDLIFLNRDFMLSNADSTIVKTFLKSILSITVTYHEIVSLQFWYIKVSQENKLPSLAELLLLHYFHHCRIYFNPSIIALHGNFAFTSTQENS